MKVDLSKCTELVPGVFKKTDKTFYIKDSVTGRLVYCNKEKMDKLVAKHGSIDNVGKEFTAKKVVAKKTASKKTAKAGVKNLVKSSVELIEAELINDSGKKVGTFTSTSVSQDGNVVVYPFENAKFDHQFVFVIKLNEKLFHPAAKSFKEVKVKMFNGKTEETYEAVYDKEMDYYCVLDCDASLQLVSIEIEH